MVSSLQGLRDAKTLKLDTPTVRKRGIRLVRHRASKRGSRYAGVVCRYPLSIAGIAATATREQFYRDPRFSGHATLIIDQEFKL